MGRERIVLVDGSAIVFRAFFAIPSSFRTTTGIPTNATYGFALMFRKLFAGKKPAKGAVVFDAPGRTFRDERYPKYKAQRPRMPGELAQQVPWIRRVVEAHDFPMIAVPGYEADDVIGTLTRIALDAGYEVLIVSGDKDFAQLIGEHVRMFDPVKDVTYDAELVRKKWGVTPDKFVDFLALVGDKIDNIPGIPGVGPKSAIGLLEAHGDLEGVLAAAPTIKGKLRQRLEEGAGDARLSRDLALIDQHVPPSELGVARRDPFGDSPHAFDMAADDPRAADPAAAFAIGDLSVPEVDRPKVDALYRELEFFSLLSGEEPRGDGPARDHGLLGAGELADFLRELTEGGVPVAVICTHTLPSEVHGAWLGIALASTAEPGRARYVALRGRDALGEDAGGLVRGFLEDATIPKVVHDLRDMSTLFLRHGVELRGATFDTQLASYLIDPTRDIPHRLEQIVRTHLHRALSPVKTLIGAGKQLRDLETVPAEELSRFACERTTALAEIYGPVAERLDAEEHAEVLARLMLPLSRVLADMQIDGIGVDGAVLDALGREFEERKQSVEQDVHALAGRSFNIGSQKQLGEVLFDELGLPILKRTKTGYSTAADVLERLAPKHDIAAKVVRWRTLAKLINTYTRVLREAISPRTGRIHCTFQQTVSASGRIITTDPDLQRTPIRTEDGRRIREAFVSRPGFVMLSADWSQIELRILAHVTGDPLLVQSFRDDVDVHRRTAGEIYGVAPDAVTKEQREVGKTVNFATIYGQGATALGQQLGISRAEAKRAIDRYFEVYAGVRRWLDETVTQAYRDGFVETLGGRRRYIPELSSNNMTDRSYGERIATNTPIQGSGADICMMAMLAIAGQLRERSMTTRMLLQIHDELLFECPLEELDDAKAVVLAGMREAFPLAVPLKVDIGHGVSWAAAH